jgi:LAO/AO transport system kinase
MTSDLPTLISQARAGSIRAAARLMSVMVDQPHRLAELLSGSGDWPQARLVLGITGAPGSGKSTLTDHLAHEYRTRFPDRRLGIVAVDPSSPFTGGALLGDRVRMMRHATDPMVFIRSLASRGHLGGLALGAKGVARVMGLIGCDVVLVETVGVGQSEVEVAMSCDLTMVVLAPGQGDSIQMLKAGLMEAGDLFVVNKADREGANQLYQSLLGALQLEAMAKIEMARCSDVNDVQENVFLVSAAQHQNINGLVDALESITARSQSSWAAQRREQVYDEVKQSLLEEVRRRVIRTIGVNGHSQARLGRVLSGETTVQRLATEILSEVSE